MSTRWFQVSPTFLAAAAMACAPQGQNPRTTEAIGNQHQSAAAQPPAYGKLTREEFNRYAVRENLPVFWTVDANQNNLVDPNEVASLLFYPQKTTWARSGEFTNEFQDAYERLLSHKKSQPADKRTELLRTELDAARPMLVHSDLGNLPEAHKRFARKMLEAGRLIHELYLVQNGAYPLAGKVPADPLSQSVFRRNRGPKCVAPQTEANPNCSAIPGSPKPKLAVYPQRIQGDSFCEELTAGANATQLLSPFSVVVPGAADKLQSKDYSIAFADRMEPIAKTIEEAASEIANDTTEKALHKYLLAAATAFRDNSWHSADEPWAAMNGNNSRWYVRIGPDEVYWEPCARKSGFHMTFALINPDSIRWQERLTPVRQEMEKEIAKRAGSPYRARSVSFHLPDFIDIVTNSGDDRKPISATIGQSLPNWGPVANEGRGRTVAMTNLYNDADSLRDNLTKASSILTEGSMPPKHSVEAQLLKVILHEATHNLGPAHEYKLKGKTDDQAFGGQIASMMEELKAQTGALFLVEFLRSRGLIEDDLAKATYLECVTWAAGQVSSGMYTASGDRKAYPHVGAIHLGFMVDHGALNWDENAVAANGKDRGAFTVDLSKFASTGDELMKTVAGIKARGDRKAAQELIEKYVDGTAVPQEAIRDRFLRVPKGSLVYSISGL